MDSSWIEFAALATVAMILTGVFAFARLQRGMALLVMLALMLRIGGTVARLLVLNETYHGVGDATEYYSIGVVYASHLERFDLSIFRSDMWWGQQWWGTQAVRYTAGFVVLLVGRSMPAVSLVFALASFLGLWCFALAFREAYADKNWSKYFGWLAIWPSLWFWPSSIGKEAIVLFGLGLLTRGYVGRQGRVHWALLIAGMAVVLCIRPHFAILTALALVFAEWLAFTKTQKLSVVARLAVVTTMAGIAGWLALTQLGLDNADSREMQHFVTSRSANTFQGGSRLEAASGWLALPMAPINVMFRPFPFEAHNPQALAASVEMIALWTLAWLRRRQIAAALRRWRDSRLLRFAMPFVLILTLAFGMTFGNLGIIVRQRTIIFPFVFVLVMAPALSRATIHARRPAYIKKPLVSRD